MIFSTCTRLLYAQKRSWSYVHKEKLLLLVNVYGFELVEEKSNVGNWQRRNWQEGRGANHLPGKLKVKTGPQNVDHISVFSIVFVFSRCFFCVFQSVFLVISGFSIDIHNRIRYHFSTFLWVLPSAPPSARFFPPLRKPLDTPLVMGIHVCFIRKDGVVVLHPKLNLCSETITIKIEVQPFIFKSFSLL